MSDIDQLKAQFYDLFAQRSNTLLQLQTVDAEIQALHQAISAATISAQANDPLAVNGLEEDSEENKSQE